MVIWVGCRYSLRAEGRQLCDTDLTLKARWQLCEEQPPLGNVTSWAALGHFESSDRPKNRHADGRF